MNLYIKGRFTLLFKRLRQLLLTFFLFYFTLLSFNNSANTSTAIATLDNYSCLLLHPSCIQALYLISSSKRAVNPSLHSNCLLLHLSFVQTFPKFPVLKHFSSYRCYMTQLLLPPVTVQYLSQQTLSPIISPLRYITLNSPATSSHSGSNAFFTFSFSNSLNLSAP